MRVSAPWQDEHNVVKAWKRCVRSFAHERPPGFVERSVSGPLTRPLLAFNWSFGALLSAFAACVKIPALRDEMMEDLPLLQTVLSTYAALRYPVFKSTPVRWKGDIYFDDNAWIGLAALDIFTADGPDLWMNHAWNIYRFILDQGYDPGSGGVYWRMRPKSSLHVCSAGPTALLGARLSQLGRPVKREPIDRMIAWCWQMRNDRGVFRDHYNLVTRRIDPSVYTYNTGTPLHTVLVMDEIMPGESYGKMAEEVVACVPVLLQSGSLPTTPWFNVVLLRALAEARSRRKGDLSPILDSYRRNMAESWKSFESTDMPLVLPSSDGKAGVLLRDAAASVETLAWLHRLEA